MVTEWHAEDIKAAIRKRGETLQSLAESKGVSAKSISQALRSPCKKAEEIIAEFIEVPLHELWPDRWTVDGQRIYPRYAYLHIEDGVAEA